MQKNGDLSRANRRDATMRPFLPADAVAQPGYVRLVLSADDGPGHLRAACRKFASLCREEHASRGLIVAESSHVTSAEVADGFEAATAAVGRGFKLAVVVRGSTSARISQTVASIAARRRAVAKTFTSEHQAAGWVMG